MNADDGVIAYAVASKDVTANRQGGGGGRSGQLVFGKIRADGFATCVWRG